MDPKYFPIKTATACQLKWTWSTIRLYEGNTSSCHRVLSDSVSADTFERFHNTPKKLQDRQLMLEGRWPQGGCEYCANIEREGGSSDRMFHLQIPDLSPPELDTDLNAVHVSPRIVEIYFDNVCNMSCIYCYDGFSSKIQQENEQFGRFEKQGVVIENRAQSTEKESLTEAFWRWFDKQHSTVRRLLVLGGEPFYQPQFDECLDFFDRHPCPNLEFHVTSNLKVSADRLDYFIDRIKKLLVMRKIKRFDLTASIDCFGPEQEYVRYGIKLDQWKENFSRVVSEKWIYLNFNQTLSALTIKTVPDLMLFINRLRDHREIGHYFSTTVMTHEFLHPGIFGAGFYSSDFDQILSLMPDLTWQQKRAKKYMNGIKLQVNSCARDDHKIHQLTVFLDEIDRRRGLEWRRTFPWLAKEIAKCGIAA